jgi:hypothetical protein
VDLYFDPRFGPARSHDSTGYIALRETFDNAATHGGYFVLLDEPSSRGRIYITGVTAHRTICQDMIYIYKVCAALVMRTMSLILIVEGVPVFAKHLGPVFTVAKTLASKKLV